MFKVERISIVLDDFIVAVYLSRKFNPKSNHVL